jgi:hypothetical protein
MNKTEADGYKKQNLLATFIRITEKNRVGIRL